MMAVKISAILSFVFLFATPLQAQDITLNGVAYNMDTLQQMIPGPGCEYWATRLTRVSDGAGRLDVYFLRVDTKNKYIHMEQQLGTGKLIGVETPTAIMNRLTTDTHILVGGTNGDFFVTVGDVGRPQGLTIGNSEYAYIGSRERNVGAVGVDGLAVLGDTWSWSGKLVLADTTLKIQRVNYQRNENQLVLYNYHNGATTNTNEWGTEVVAELAAGETWKTNGTTRLVVKSVTPNTGNSTINKDEVILSGHGTMSTMLQKLQIGDEVEVKYSLKINDAAVDIAQAIGSDDYAMIVKNGVVPTSDYWDELHPRTGFGANKTGDVLLMCVVDGRGKSVGVTTKVLGELMLHNGAWNAVNWDGGGSSCLTLNHLGQMNVPADVSGERATCNGMFVVADVPSVDSVIATILPHDYAYTLPYYGMYTPKFYGYNQYGILIDTDVQGVKLSCDASLGEIQADGSFLASGTKDGLLHAVLGDITTTIEITVNRDAQMAFRLDSVWVDNRKPYEIEVVSHVDGNMVNLPARALEWIVEDESICVVNEQGELIGISTGRTNVVGRMGELADTLGVHVQIPPASEYLWENFVNHDSWEVTATAKFNPTFPDPTSSVLPVVLDFTYAIGRKPFIMLAKDVPLYGLPDSVRLHLNTDAIIDNIVLTLHANNQSATQYVTHKFQPVPTNIDTTFSVAITDFFDTSDRAVYPIWMKTIRFNLSTETSEGAHKIALRGISLYYDGVEVDYLYNSTMPKWQVYPNPVINEVLQVANVQVGANLVLSDLQGRELLKQRVNSDNLQINLQAYPTGQYLLSIDNQTVKIIKQ